ncbi:uncharacterized protein MYCFIDRAFT_169370 [Pseudocercospora fijiensis CIRAD86]|uniref:Uncharacterized protein n=1 Tax=Pseudocercospora fijiensis (strain CIRAD86) TaxID=383855 RepID=N1Q7G3_PSEFD|nr:uncharacterized protein MYCFIDRAFT_169370 [Pseudocercospora fijiensis CIRAD86]EME87561.1 hypothetical protein MYCFIDRAFT_169370 [Pseudocercospora fijiensis CIRAD86]
MDKSRVPRLGERNVGFPLALTVLSFPFSIYRVIRRAADFIIASSNAPTSHEGQAGLKASHLDNLSAGPQPRHKNRQRLAAAWNAFLDIAGLKAEVWNTVRDVLKDANLYPQDIEEEMHLLSAANAKRYGISQHTNFLDGSAISVGSVERIKSKTRPGDMSDEELRGDGATISSVAQPEPVISPRIPLRRESLLTLSKMLPSNSSRSSDSNSSQPWQTQVSQLRKHYGGAAVAFSPVTTSGSAGSIIFHKPHPDPELDPVMLHAIGKRMHKWLGWNSRMWWFWFGVDLPFDTLTKCWICDQDWRTLTQVLVKHHKQEDPLDNSTEGHARKGDRRIKKSNV